jgi:hypothetical protein
MNTKTVMRIAQDICPPIGFTIIRGKNKFNRILKRRIFFIGNCFCCGSERHTQAYCPLSQCQYCNEWGHTLKVCRRKNCHK